MATASSAQREPSMEEILASIRRIIEDSDGGRKQPDEAIGPAEEAAPDDAAAETATPEVDVFRAELRTGDPDSEPKKPVSLAEVQARLASDQAHVPPAMGETEASGGPARPATLAEVGARVTAAEAEAATGPHQRTDDAPEAVEARDAGIEPAADEPQIEFGDDDLVIEDEPAPVPASEDAVFRPALVSEQTSRQVAAAFGELSDAFAARGKKSFDEMAEEMLRPMLQDWLDNNLPTLVERLVREEIERVARGAG